MKCKCSLQPDCIQVCAAENCICAAPVIEPASLGLTELMTDTINHPAQWRSEIRATLTLAWPLVLTNLAQMAMTTTDVMILGWLGPAALAAGGLGANLYIALVIFGIGVVTAVSPMLARTLGENRFAVREVRRTVRQGLWVSVALAVPIWLVLWQTGPNPARNGPGPGIGGRTPRFMCG